jgi:hypothetical protein
MTRIACSTSWKCEPFKEGLPLPYQATFNCEQFARLKTGLIPLEMEDKWFIYYEEPYLFLHRSWTGMPVYRLTFRGISDGAEVTEALWSKEIADRVSSSSDYEVRLLDFLVSNLCSVSQKHSQCFPATKIRLASISTR